jgi:protein phosphatase
LEDQIVTIIKYIQFSEKGPRMKNEDCLNIVEVSDKRTLFVVCDGMGGHSCGEVASKTVCDSFSAYWQEHPDSIDSVQKIEDAAKVASQVIDEVSGYYHMGTTLVMASIEGQTAHIAHAGDSRCYVIDIKGNVKYRTIDHIESSSISLPYINSAFFTRHPEDAVPDVKVVELQPLDRILLCTDGLYNAIDDTTLLHTLQCAKDVEQVAEKYQTICQEKAGDNYTAIIIEIE